MWPSFKWHLDKSDIYTKKKVTRTTFTKEIHKSNIWPIMTKKNSFTNQKYKKILYYIDIEVRTHSLHHTYIHFWQIYMINLNSSHFLTQLVKLFDIWQLHSLFSITFRTKNRIRIFFVNSLRAEWQNIIEDIDIEKITDNQQISYNQINQQETTKCFYSTFKGNQLTHKYW